MTYRKLYSGDEETIETTNDYVTYIEKLHRSADNSNLILFRGQEHDWALLPKIARLKPKNKILLYEKQMLNEFKRKSIPYLNNFKPESLWDWLTLAQHHGLPTRLLDWTENPLAALWFCISKKPKDESPGVVWVLITSEEDFVDLDDKAPFNQQRTKVFQPKHIANRIIAQKSWFTVHKYVKKEKKFIPLENNTTYAKHLRKLIIPAKRFSEMEVTLYHYGIDTYSLFPELDKLCNLIKWKTVPSSKDSYNKLLKALVESSKLLAKDPKYFRESNK